MSLHHHHRHVGLLNLYVTFVFTKYFCCSSTYHFHVHLGRCIVIPILQISKLRVREGLISCWHIE